MAIRKRHWTYKGVTKSAWMVDYFDASGKRRRKSFKTKSDARDWAAKAHVELKSGVHVADGASISVAKAAEGWLATCAREGLERSTRSSYRTHVDLHIVPCIGSLRLNQLTVPAIREFEDRLRESGRSAELTRKVIISLGSLIADAQERGLTAHNPVRERKRRRNGHNGRHKQRLAIGMHIPSAKEIGTLLRLPSPPRWQALFAVAAMTGLRLSELRGLAWRNLDLRANTLNVTQRADAWGDLGSPKAAASRRAIPLSQFVVESLQRWQPHCPKCDDDLVFPSERGYVEPHGHTIGKAWEALQIRGKVVTDTGEAKYRGLHCLRHFYASWCAARREDGGLGLPLKTVQARMGHSTLAMTADTYGHLFPSTDDAELLREGEKTLFGTV